MARDLNSKEKKNHGRSNLNRQVKSQKTLRPWEGWWEIKVAKRVLNLEGLVKGDGRTKKKPDEKREVISDSGKYHRGDIWDRE